MCSSSMFSIDRRQRSYTLFPYTTLFRSTKSGEGFTEKLLGSKALPQLLGPGGFFILEKRPGESLPEMKKPPGPSNCRSEEHTCELQSHSDLVCRLLLEKKNKESRHVITN